MMGWLTSPAMPLHAILKVFDIVRPIKQYYIYVLISWCITWNCFIAMYGNPQVAFLRLSFIKLNPQLTSLMLL